MQETVARGAAERSCPTRSSRDRRQARRRAREACENGLWRALHGRGARPCGGEDLLKLATEIERRERLSRGVLAARVMGQHSSPGDVLIRNCAQHAKLLPEDGARLALWREAERGPRLGAPSSATVCRQESEEHGGGGAAQTGGTVWHVAELEASFSAKAVGKHTENDGLRADAPVFMPGAGRWEVLPESRLPSQVGPVTRGPECGMRCTCGATVYSSALQDDSFVKDVMEDEESDEYRAEEQRAGLLERNLEEQVQAFEAEVPETDATTACTAAVAEPFASPTLVEYLDTFPEALLRGGETGLPFARRRGTPRPTRAPSAASADSFETAHSRRRGTPRPSRAPSSASAASSETGPEQQDDEGSSVDGEDQAVQKLEALPKVQQPEVQQGVALNQAQARLRRAEAAFKRTIEDIEEGEKWIQDLKVQRENWIVEVADAEAEEYTKWIALPVTAMKQDHAPRVGKPFVRRRAKLDAFRCEVGSEFLLQVGEDGATLGL